MSTSISAWCEMMEQFLAELEKVFPDEPGIKKYHATYDLVKKANPRKCVEGYMSGCANYSQYIMQKDEAFFMEHSDTIDFLRHMNIKKHWVDPDLSQTTKDAIWQYIQTLYILGTTITNIPTEALSMIEDVANKCASQMQQGGDEKELMNGMSGLFSSLGNMLQNAPEKN